MKNDQTWSIEITDIGHSLESSWTIAELRNHEGICAVHMATRLVGGTARTAQIFLPLLYPTSSLLDKGLALPRGGPLFFLTDATARPIKDAQSQSLRRQTSGRQAGGCRAQAKGVRGLNREASPTRAEASRTRCQQEFSRHIRALVESAVHAYG